MALTDQLVAYWKLDESTGNATDVVGGVTLSNTNATYGAGLINNGVNFGTAQNAYLSTTGNLGSIGGGAISVSLWVKLNAEIASGQWGIYDHAYSGTHTETWIRYQYNGGTRRLQFERLRGGVADDQFTSNIALGTSVYHHLVLTYDGSTVTGYVDGSSVGTVASSGNGSADTNNGFFLNDDATPVDINGKAKMDEVGVWSRALSSAEVTQLYNGGVGLQYPFTTSRPALSLLGVGS